MIDEDDRKVAGSLIHEASLLQEILDAAGDPMEVRLSSDSLIRIAVLMRHAAALLIEVL